VEQGNKPWYQPTTEQLSMRKLVAKKSKKNEEALPDVFSFFFPEASLILGFSFSLLTAS